MVCSASSRQKGDCFVTQTVHLRSRTAGHLVHVLYCALSELFPKDRCHPEQVNKSALFSVGADGKARKVLLPVDLAGSEETGDYVYAAILKTQARREFLIVPVRVSGTGNMNTSHYYEIREGRFIQLAANLERELQAKLPKGMEVWKGIWPDFDTMRFIRSLWKEGDGNCCPSAGIAIGEIEFAETRLRIKRLRVFRGDTAIDREVAKWDAAQKKRKTQ